MPPDGGSPITAGLAQSPGGQRVSHGQPAASGAAWVFAHGTGALSLRIIGPSVTATGVLPPWPAERAQRMRGPAEPRGTPGGYCRDTAECAGQRADVDAHSDPRYRNEAHSLLLMVLDDHYHEAQLWGLYLRMRTREEGSKHGK